MKYPTGFAYDSLNKRCFVSGGSNAENRVLVFDLSSGVTSGMNASAVIGQINFTDHNNNANQYSMWDPEIGMDFDTTNNRLYITDSGNNRVMIFTFVKITNASLGTGTVGSAYSATLNTSGDQGVVTWEVSSGTLPTGLTLNASTGVISGTPTTPGSSTFTIKATDTPLYDTQIFTDSKEFTITISASLPVVTTSTASALTLSGATLNGNITSIGGASVTTRGFNYGLTGSYGTDITLSGSFGIETFSSILTTLKCGREYHYRSYATNTAGTAYGSDEIFETTRCPQSGGSSGGARQTILAPQTFPNPINIPTPNFTPPLNPTTPTNPSDTAQPHTYNFGLSTLKKGSKGEAVKELQRFLNKALTISLGVDGQLGPKTVIAIKKWQKLHGLVADGVVGPKTKAKMNLN